MSLAMFLQQVPRKYFQLSSLRCPWILWNLRKNSFQNLRYLTVDRNCVCRNQPDPEIYALFFYLVLIGDSNASRIQPRAVSISTWYIYMWKGMHGTSDILQGILVLHEKYQKWVETSLSCFTITVSWDRIFAYNMNTHAYHIHIWYTQHKRSGHVVIQLACLYIKWYKLNTLSLASLYELLRFVRHRTIVSQDNLNWISTRTDWEAFV